MIAFVLIATLVLNPYTPLGPLGYYIALPASTFAILYGFGYFRRQIFLLFAVCMTISLIGVASSYIHNITQFGHLITSLGIMVNYMVGIGLFILFRNRYRFEDVLVFALCAGIMNGIIIIAQVQYPPLRAMVESLLTDSGNIDWSVGFRYRGLASGGGASLSVLSAVLIYIGFYLFEIRKINALSLFAAVGILFVSVLFVGRTGVFLTFLAFAAAFTLPRFRKIRIILILASFILFFILLCLPLVKAFLIHYYGVGFFDYALGFILRGASGIRDEGTAEVILGFLAVVPTQFPQVLTGYGFYGQGNFLPWTDSGYSRMFLSVGFLFGFSYYICIFLILLKSARGNHLMFLPIIGLLLVAEAKEPLLLSGYSSRLLFVLLGYWVAQKGFDSKLSKNRDLSIVS